MANVPPFLTSKKTVPILAGILLGLLLFILVQSCMLHQEATFHIGQESEWKSLDLMGKERNLTAFNQQLLTAIAKQEKFSITISSKPAKELINALEQGTLQGILTSLQPNYLNENRLVFSDPYFLTGPVLIIPSTAPVRNWNEMARKIVAIPANSAILGGLEQDPTIQIKIYDSILPALADLSTHRIDGAIFPAIPAYTYVSTFYKNELKIATLPLTSDGVRLVARNTEEGKKLVNLFNQGIAVIKKEGEFNKMLNDWGLINVENIAGN